MYQNQCCFCYLFMTTLMISGDIHSKWIWSPCMRNIGSKASSKAINIKIVIRGDTKLPKDSGEQCSGSFWA